jgi:hypothetical protein
MSQAAKVYVSIEASAAQDGESHSAYVRINEPLSDGTDADEADLCFKMLTDIAYPSTPLELDLGDGSVDDINGDPLVMKEVVTVIIQQKPNDDDEESECTVDFDFGAGAYQWTEPLIAGGHIVKHAPAANGYSTTAAGPHITITPIEGTNVRVDILVLGRSLS